jgi:hypothetical protein
MCWEETEETVIHEGISQWGTAEGQTDTFCLWADSIWRDLTPDICLGRSITIHITHSRRTTNKGYMAQMQHEYLNVL